MTVVSLNVTGQNVPITPLKIGDRIPDFLLKNLINYKTESEKASSFYQQGLLIINFWATWCIPCVRTLPYLDSTIAKYPKTVRMVCVTDQQKDIIDKYLRNRRFYHLIFATDDKQLSKYFPHSGIPHNIWIDKQGYVRAITDDDQITDKHIIDFESGKVNMFIKKDKPFDWQKPLTVADQDFLYRSVLTGEKDEIGTGGMLMPDTIDNQTRFMGWNLPKTNMIWAAYMRTAFSLRDFNLMEIHAKDTSSYYTPSNANTDNWNDSTKMNAYELWRHKNEYCYELYFRSKVNIETFYSLMAKEINQFFNITAKIEDKETNCWVIVKQKPGNQPNVSNHFNETAFYLNSTSIIAEKQTIKQIAYSLSDLYGQQPPFVDQTGITYPIDLNYNFKIAGESLTIKSLRSYFNSIGLDIILKKVQYPHLIIYDHSL